MVERKPGTGIVAQPRRIVSPFPGRRRFLGIARAALPGNAGLEIIAAFAENHIACRCSIRLAPARAHGARFRGAVMRHLVVIAAGLLLLLAGVVTPARAQSEADWKACRGSDLDARIAGCTRLIERGRKMSDRDRAAAYNGRAYAHNERSQYDLAIRDLDMAIRFDPTNTSSLNNRGYAYNGKGDWDRAIRDYDEAIRINPKFATAFGNRARSYQNKGDFERALHDFDEAIRLDPSAGKYNLRGNAYFAKGDYERSITDYSEAIRLDPKSAVYANNRGNAYRNNKNYDRALSDLDEALRLNPNYVIALQNRGHTYYARNDFDRAIRDYDEAIRLDPKSAANYNFRGNSYRSKGDEDRALADYDRAVNLDPRNATMLRNRGQAYLTKGDTDRGLRDLDEAIRLSPRDAGGYNLRGLAYKQRRDFDRAISDFDEAIRLSPRFASAFSNRGDTYRLKSDIDRAIGDLSEALRLDPKVGPAYTSRGLAYEEKGDRERARADFKAAIGLPSSGFVYGKWALDTARAHLATIEAGAPKLSAALTPPPPVLSALSPPTAAPEQSGARGRRVALVVGNGAYRFATPLPNPTNDAADMAQALRNLGFDVVEGRDLDKRGMESRIRDFARKLDGADLALFFYAGHGLQVADKNYLVPVDAKLERPGDLSFDTVTVDDVLVQMESEPRVNLVFLDACRDNPLARTLARSLGARSITVGQGLAPIQSAVGTMIVYATQPKNIALDGEGRNSPFTTALLKYIPTPGLEIGAVMKRVRADVYKSTREKQLPWDHSSLIGDVVLAR
jgi:tetratricopeptide (TPR) repeat protein